MASINSPKTVLHVVKRLDDVGNGITNACLDLTTEQARRGREVYVATTGGRELIHLLEDNGVNVIKLGSRKPLLQALELRRLIARIRPSIVHAHTLTGLLIAKTAMVCSPSARLVSTAHREDRALWLHRLADAVITLSPRGVEKLRANRVPASKLWITQMGATNGVRLRQLALGVGADAVSLHGPAILTVSGLYQNKGVGVLIGAFARSGLCRRAHLYIVGDGPDRRLFEQQVAQLGISERVHFEGFHQNPLSSGSPSI